MNLASILASLTSSRQQNPSRFSWMSFLTIAAMLFAVSVLSSPVPGVNEPHYLCKARSFSDHTWCARDFFLASSNAHYCFFWLIGPLTKIYSFATVALVGRGLSVLAIAVGFSLLCREIGLSPLSRIIAAGTFTSLSEVGSFSGEWLLGGFESKVPAWGLGLAAIALWIRGSIRNCPGWMTASGACCGVAALLHPVVGGWIAVCLCMVWLLNCCGLRPMAGTANAINSNGPKSIAVKSILGLLSFSFATIVLALPGLIPAMRLVLDDSLDRKNRELAAFIQVYWRLKHHLDPTELVPAQWIYAFGLSTLLLVGYGLVQRRLRIQSADNGLQNTGESPCLRRQEIRLLLQIFLASMVIAIIGVVVGWHSENSQNMTGWQWRASLLKFYPFRTFDALLPIVSGMMIALLFQQSRLNRLMPAVPILLVFSCGMPLVAAVSSREASPAGYTAIQFADWQAACAWIKAETPPDSLFLTPRESFAFKWMAERAEYVCYKDCPQDAEGILEWNRRLWWLHDWTLQSSTDGVYQESDLQRLHNKTGCDFILSRILGPFEAQPVWQGREWQVIRVPHPE